MFLGILPSFRVSVLLTPLLSSSLYLYYTKCRHWFENLCLTMGIRAWDLFKLGYRLHNEKWILLTLYDALTPTAILHAIQLCCFMALGFFDSKYWSYSWLTWKSLWIKASNKLPNANCNYVNSHRCTCGHQTLDLLDNHTFIKPGESLIEIQHVFHKSVLAQDKQQHT